MPITKFICPGEERKGKIISVKKCLSTLGCPFGRRCSTLPYLRMVSNNRDWRGVTPSMAGNGPRLIMLQEVVNYAVNPYDQSWAALGTGVHGKLSVHYLIKGLISEQGFSDDLIKAIPDLLEPDENNIGFYLLYDYKTWGSYKVRKAIGIVEDKDNPKKDKRGNILKYTSGYKKGQTKYHVKTDPNAVDCFDTELQLNRYRIIVESHGFPISRMQVQAIVRDGNTYMATSRDIHEPIYLVDIKRLDDDYVLDFYKRLQEECDQAFKDGWIRKCDARESWSGRRCKSYCPVVKQCKEMEKGKKFFKKAA
jgi:hypothetical protein